MACLLIDGFRLIRDIKDYDKMGGLKRELSRLCQQIFVVKECCFRQNKSMMAMLNLQIRGITEDKILQLNAQSTNSGNNRRQDTTAE
jgi:hypothetical protein